MSLLYPRALSSPEKKICVINEEPSLLFTQSSFSPSYLFLFFSGDIPEIKNKIKIKIYINKDVIKSNKFLAIYAHYSNLKVFYR